MFPSRSRSGPRPPSRSVPVIAVGQRVFINCPGDRTGSVPLEDESGKGPVSIRLTDGVVVEIVAWRPRGTSDPRYRVRRASDGADGWVGAESLRRTQVPVVAPSEPDAAPVTTPSFDENDAEARPFGQRTHREFVPRIATSPTSPTSLPPTLPDAGGRRFGQR